MTDDSFLDILQGSKLTDTVINYVLDLITKTTQIHTADTLLFLVPDQLSFIGNVQAIFVLYRGQYDGKDGHWFTCHHFNKRITIYDSLGQGTLCTNHIISFDKIFGQGEYTISHGSVKSKQTNNIDCGVYALAYAIEIALAGDVENTIYDHVVMRTFLYHKIIKPRTLLLFPKIIPKHIMAYEYSICLMKYMKSYLYDKGYILLNSVPRHEQLAKTIYLWKDFANVFTLYITNIFYRFTSFRVNKTINRELKPINQEESSIRLLYTNFRIHSSNFLVKLLLFFKVILDILHRKVPENKIYEKSEIYNTLYFLLDYNNDKQQEQNQNKICI